MENDEKGEMVEKGGKGEGKGNIPHLYKGGVLRCRSPKISSRSNVFGDSQKSQLSIEDLTLDKLQKPKS